MDTENQKSLIVHICCAPCMSGLTDHFKSLGFSKIMGYFFNPNIHPFREYKKRRHTLRENEKFFNFDEIEYSDSYPIDEILRGMIEAYDRCQFCFKTRLEETASKGREKGYTHFTSTLLISPYQKQDLLVSIGHEIAEKYSLVFLGDDLRMFYDKSRETANEKDMYQQGYCGCVFSEYERYSKKKPINPQKED